MTREARTAPDWRGWNDRHVALAIERCRLAVAAQLSPEADAEAVRTRLAALAAEQTEAEAALRAAGHAPALAALAERLDLTPVESEIVALGLAAELDVETATMLARAGRAGPHLTAGLAAALAGANTPSGRLVFSPAGTLVGLRVIELATDLPLAAAPLRLSARIRDFLLGLDRLDEEAAGLLVPMERASLSPALTRIARDLAKADAAVLVGPADAGGRAVAAAAAALRGRTAVRLDPSRLPAEPGPRDRALALVAREWMLSRLVLVADLHGIADPSLVMPLLRRRVGPMLVLAPTRAGLPAGLHAVCLPPSDAPAREALWRAAAPKLARSDVARLARQFALTPEAITRIAADVPPGRARGEALWARAREEAAPALAGLGQRIVPHATWHDLVLPPDTTEALKAVADAARARAIVDRWGFARQDGRG
uniref:hypothetical protein n=1 Tax=Elioraea sp. TaxID=2185103 RepID=UPI003F72559D